MVKGNKSLRTIKLLFAGTLYVVDIPLLADSLIFVELSVGSIRWASKDLSVVTLTTNSMTESGFSIGGAHVTFNCFSFKGSTSTSSGGLGRSSAKIFNVSFAF